MATVAFYYNDNNKTKVKIELDDENINLSQLFAEFVEFTRIMGYQPGSWENIIKELNQINFDQQYTINDWVTDVLVEV